MKCKVKKRIKQVLQNWNPSISSRMWVTTVWRKASLMERNSVMRLLTDGLLQRVRSVINVKHTKRTLVDSINDQADVPWTHLLNNWNNLSDTFNQEPQQHVRRKYDQWSLNFERNGPNFYHSYKTSQKSKVLWDTLFVCFLNTLMYGHCLNDGFKPN